LLFEELIFHRDARVHQHSYEPLCGLRKLDNVASSGKFLIAGAETCGRALYLDALLMKYARELVGSRSVASARQHVSLYLLGRPFL
jgi:hypothetical protein